MIAIHTGLDCRVAASSALHQLKSRVYDSLNIYRCSATCSGCRHSRCGAWRPACVPNPVRRRPRCRRQGMAVCVLVTVAAAGLLATHLDPRRFALDGLTRLYLRNLVFSTQLWLPRTFEGQQWAGTVNPMLWTLLPGLLCCLSVPAVSLLPPRMRRVSLAAGACLGLAALALPPVKGATFYHPRHLEILTELPFFFVAWALAYAPERAWRADLAMLLFMANWVSATWLGGLNYPLEAVSLPYMLICFGRMTMPVLGGIGRFGRPGYGVFLYAFPIQQLIVARWPDCPAPIPLCGAAALAAGYLSWHLVERPAMRFSGSWLARRKLAAA